MYNRTNERGLFYNDISRRCLTFTSSETVQLFYDEVQAKIPSLREEVLQVFCSGWGEFFCSFLNCSLCTRELRFP